MTQKEKKLSILFDQINDYYSPKIIGEVNDTFIKLVLAKGDEIPWHSHQNEDEMFLVLEGQLLMEIEGQESFSLAQGEFYIIKKGIKHKVSAKEECRMMLIEPKATKHTGEVNTGITKNIKEQYL